MRARIVVIVAWGVAGGCAAATSGPPPVGAAPLSAPAPVAAPAGPMPATDLAWGGAFCALRSDGRVACWGTDGGALGDGSLEARSTPALVPGVDNVVRLRAFPWKGLCALRADRSLWCWGFGRVGSPLAPTRVLGDVVDFAFSDDQSSLTSNAGSLPGVCARRVDGSVRCVQFSPSDTSSRQVCLYWSDAAHTRCLSARFPVDVVVAPFLDDGAVQISETGNVLPPTPNNRPCILLGRQVHCRGGNELGQLGDPALRESPTFVAIPGLGDVVSLVSWAQTSCAVRTTGQVVCWGRNDGDLRVPADARPCIWAAAGNVKQGCTRRPTPMPVADAVQITEGRLGLTILTRGGDVLLSRDLYVRGLRIAKDTFVKASGLPPLARIELGHYGLCGLTSTGDVACYGYASELGDGAPWINRVPRRVADVTGAVMVRVQNVGGACAARADGTSTCWGTYNVPQGLPPVTSFGDGCATARDGRVWCWGYNGSGEMGLGYQYRDGLRKEPKGDYWAITDTPLPVPHLGDVVDLASNSSRRCTVDRAGEVRCWGYFVPPRMFTWSPKPFEGLPPAKQVAIAGLEILVLARDGSLWNVAEDHPKGVAISRVEPGSILMLGTHAEEPPGKNSRSQPDRCLVLADRSLRCTGGPAPINHPGPVAQLSVNQDRGCAVLLDGRLICWGRPYCAETSDSYCRGDFWSEIDLLLHGVSQVSVGRNYACAVRTDGSVWCWGNMLPRPEGGAQITKPRTSRVDLGAAR